MTLTTRRLLAALLTLVGFVAATLVSPVAIAAAPVVDPHARGDGVKKATKSWHQLDGGQVYLKQARLCARWTYNANWKVQIAIDNNQEIWAFENPRMSDPDLWVRFYKTCAADAPVRKSSRITAKTYISASNFSLRLCSLNPSLAVGYPWSVQVGIAPTCSDDTDRASRTRVVEPRKPKPGFHFASTGQVALWDKFEWWHNGDNDRSLRACFKLRVYLDVQNAAGTAVDDATTKPVTDNFCLPVGSWAMALAKRS